MITLLDASVLIPLVDCNHVHAATAVEFFEQQAVPLGWATCPLTENAFLRIMGRSGSERTFGSTSAARRVLNHLRAAPGHVFWPDDVSLADARFFPSLPASKHLTNLYLLGLAVKHGGRFATFDRGLDAALVPGDPAACLVLPSA